MKTTTTLGAVAVALALTACRSPNAKLCAKLLEDGEKKAGISNEDGAMTRACLKQNEDVKQKSPAAYEKMMKCADEKTSHDAESCVLTVLTNDEAWRTRAAAESSAEMTAYLDKKASGAIAATRSIARWPSLATKRFEGKLTHASDRRKGQLTDFTIDLTDGFRMIGAERDLAIFSFTDPKVPDSDTLYVDVSVDDYELDFEAVTQGFFGHGETTVLKKEKTDSGYVLARTVPGTPAATNVLVHKSIDGGALECKASFEDPEVADHKDDVVAWLLKLCGTLAVKK